MIPLPLIYIIVMIINLCVAIAVCAMDPDPVEIIDFVGGFMLGGVPITVVYTILMLLL
jgi:hypothetical protein